MSNTTFHIHKGKITNPSIVRKYFDEVLKEDGKYSLTIKPFKIRSNDQNQYYWAVCVPMVKDGLRDAGYNEVKTNNDAHEILKHLFLKKKFYSDKLDTEIVIDGSTTNLTTVEFNVYLEEIWQWSAQYLSITIPAPNQQASIIFAEYDQERQAVIVS